MFLLFIVVFCLFVRWPNARRIHTAHLVYCTTCDSEFFECFFPTFAHVFISRAPIKNLFARKITKKAILLQVNNGLYGKKWQEMRRLGLRGFLISFSFLWNANRWRFFRRCRRFMYTRHDAVHYISFFYQLKKMYLNRIIFIARMTGLSGEIKCTRNALYTQRVCAVW